MGKDNLSDLFTDAVGGLDFFAHQARFAATYIGYHAAPA